ncbi:hypothetical protein FVE85_3045 [Porphyridium purpureum]|uniref:Protein Abitram n=1 Tax=Porphyridium purpureum TaxID=35688 RepID=A0A5J4YVS0_PORPP|nr:hypothetical protein FVE85_3045 [Porphyridium purpureum]|eukprot:POR1789..scf227_4
MASRADVAALSLREREYAVRVCTKTHVRVYRHPSGTMVLCLAERHLLRRLHGDGACALSAQLKMLRVREFQKGRGKSRQKGASKLQPGQWLISVLSQGTDSAQSGAPDDNRASRETTVDSPVHGFLVEINDRLQAEPVLMISDPDNCGFIAIFRAPGFGKSQTDGGFWNALVSNEEYLSQNAKQE